MRLIILILIGFFISGCANKYVVSESAGYIQGWEKDDLFNALNGKKIRFLVNNSYTIKSSEILFGVEHMERNFSFEQSSASEKKQLIISMFFLTPTSIEVGGAYKLVANNKVYAPVIIRAGDRDKNIYSCIANEDKKIVAGENINISDKQCMLLSYDIKIPPENNFNLSFRMIDGGIESNLNVFFTNQQREAISTH